MKWFVLPGARRRPGRADAPASRDREPAGIDFLRAHAELAGSKRHQADARSSDSSVPAEAADLETLLKAAEQAEKRADWPEAERLWMMMRTVYPQIWYSYTGVATALCGLGRMDEAAALLSDAAGRFPREHAIRHELGRLAVRRLDWPAAEAHWRAALTFETRPWWLYTELATALCALGREAEAAQVLSDGTVDSPCEPTIRHELGRLAVRQGDWPAAEGHWRAALAFAVRPWWVYTGLASALCAMDRVEDARQVLSEAATTFPHEPAIRHELGHLAVRRGDWPAAEGHWRAALTFAVRPWWVYTGLASALCALDRIEDARQVLSEAAIGFPHEPAIRHELGHLAVRRGDWPEAETHWRAALAFAVRPWWVHSELASALCALDRVEEARQVLSEAAVGLPNEPAVRHQLGRLAARQRNWPAAEAHWRAALTFDPRPWWVYTELAGALEEQGRLAEAEAVLLDGQAHDPGEVSLFTAHARLAWDHEDWPAAVTRWAEASRRFPISEALSSGLYQALMRLAEHDPVAADAAHSALALASVDADDARRTLLLGFESLGGSGPDGGCEFGGVQRERGAEPLGLFRWATVSPPNLIACLTGRFAGIGEADRTTVYLHDKDPQALWQIGDKAYGTAMHSFVPSSDVPHDRMLILACKRMSYLRDKLIADLEHPAKIFVLKVAGRQVTDKETEALSQAIRSYGQGELLCVCPADGSHPAGRIVPAAASVFIGYIDFSGRLDVVQRHSAWESMCEAMLKLSRTRRD